MTCNCDPRHGPHRSAGLLIACVRCCRYVPQVCVRLLVLLQPYIVIISKEASSVSCVMSSCKLLK